MDNLGSIDRTIKSFNKVLDKMSSFSTLDGILKAKAKKSIEAERKSRAKAPEVNEASKARRVTVSLSLFRALNDATFAKERSWKAATPAKERSWKVASPSSNTRIGEEITHERREIAHKGEEVKDPHEGEEVKDPHEGGEVKDLHEGGEVKDLDEGGEVKDLDEGGEVKDLDEGGEVKDLDEGGEVKDLDEGEEVKDLHTGKNIEDLLDELNK